MCTCLLFPPRVSAATHYVSISSSNPASPFLSWANAATSIQAAISVAAPSDTVLVADGTYASGYSQGARVAITNVIQVRSVNGPDSTFIDGTGSGRCVFVRSGATIAGFSLRRGNGWAGGSGQNGGGALCEAGATVSNCVIEDSWALYGGGVYQGTVKSSVLRRNNSIYGGAVAFCKAGDFVQNCIITSNRGGYGGGAFYCMLRNCLIVGNTSSNTGGGTDSCEAQNCTIVRNWAGTYGGGVSLGTNRNSIISFNNSSLGDSNWYGTVRWAFCCTTPYTNGSGQITQDPMFVDRFGDFHLTTGSPCINGGTTSNMSWLATARDLDGNPRIDGSGPDMGCYEYTPGAVPLVTITNPSTTVSSGTTDYVIGGVVSTDVVGMMMVSNSANGFQQYFFAPFGSSNRPWISPAIPLALGSNTLYAYASNYVSRDRASVYIFRESGGGPTGSLPFLCITSAPSWLPHNVSNCVLSGTSDNLAGDLVFYNQANGGTWSIPAPEWAGSSWLSPHLLLESGFNYLFVIGSNDLGTICVTAVVERAGSGPEALITITNGNVSVPFSTVSYVFQGTVGTAAVGFVRVQCQTTDTFVAMSGGPPRRWESPPISLAVGTNIMYATASNWAGVAETVQVAVFRQPAPSPTPFVWITGYPTELKPYSQSNCVIWGVASNLSGLLVFSNRTTGFICTMPAPIAPSVGWTSPDIAIAPGTNVITVRGSNVIGNVACDTATVQRAMAPLITITNTENVVPFGQSEFVLMGAFDPIVSGLLRVQGQGIDIYFPVPTNAEHHWESPLLSLQYGTNQFHVVASNSVGFADQVRFVVFREYSNETVLVTITNNPETVTQAEYVIGGEVDASVLGMMYVSNQANGFQDWFFAPTGTLRQWTSPPIPLEYGPNVLYAIASNAYGSATSSVQITRQSEAGLYYVSLSNTHPAYPYASWSTAATNIQNAVDVAPPGSTVLVSSGTYRSFTFANEALSISTSITVRSVNGPANTVIDGRNAMRCVTLSGGAQLVGFDLTHGFSMDDGGGVWCEDSCVVSNCVISGSHGNQGGGVFGGSVYNCRISGNQARTRGGGVCGKPGAGQGVFNSIITGNSASNEGGGTASCAVHNSLLVENRAAFCGAAWYCGLYNCTVVSNSAQFCGGVAEGTNWNSIVYFNKSDDGNDNYYDSTNAWHSSCTTPLPAGSDTLTNNPLFVSTGTGDFHVFSNSPCINAGSNLPWLATASDLDGNPRIIDGIVDMGCYEVAGQSVTDSWIASYDDPEHFIRVRSRTDGKGLFQYEFSHGTWNPDWAYYMRPGDGGIYLYIVGVSTVSCPSGWAARYDPAGGSVFLFVQDPAGCWILNDPIVFTALTKCVEYNLGEGEIRGPYCVIGNPNNGGTGTEGFSYLAPRRGAESYCTLWVEGAPQPYGYSVPYNYGSNLVLLDSTVTVWAVASNDITADTRHMPTGWVGSGSVPTFGTDSTVTCVMREDSTLTWNWRTEHWLNLSGSNGFCTGASAGWQPEGYIFDLFPTNPSAGFVFDHWSINGTEWGAGIPLTVTNITPMSIVAVFGTQTVSDASDDVSTRFTGWGYAPVLAAGRHIGSLEICNLTDSVKRLAEPFWYAVPSNATLHLLNPIGTETNSGCPYVDLSSSIHPQLANIGNGDLYLDPGECVTASNIEFYSDGVAVPSGTVIAVRVDLPGFGMPDTQSWDTDHDGIPNQWEDGHSTMSRNNPADADSDSDGDRMSGRQEYYADTDPGDGNSFLHFMGTRSLRDTFRLQWSGGVQATQYLERSTDLQTWKVIGTNFPPTITNLARPGHFNESGFYRIRVNAR